MSGTMGLMRMRKELKDLECKPPEGVICYPVNDSMVHLHAELEGPLDTPYAGGKFQVDINIPDRYPMEPPRCQFITRVYHPNIDDQGRICLDILKTGSKGTWKPSLSIQTVLTSLRVLLAYPNPDDPLLVDVANEFKENHAVFTHKAKEYTERHATGKTENPKLLTHAEDFTSTIPADTAGLKPSDTLESSVPTLPLSVSSSSSSRFPSSSSSQGTTGSSTISSIPNSFLGSLGSDLGPISSLGRLSLKKGLLTLKKPNLSTRKPHAQRSPSPSPDIITATTTSTPGSTADTPASVLFAPNAEPMANDTVLNEVKQDPEPTQRNSLTTTTTTTTATTAKALPLHSSPSTSSSSSPKGSSCVKPSFSSSSKKKRDFDAASTMASVSPVKKRSKKKPRTDPESPLMTATNTAIVIDDDNDLVQPEDTLSSPLLAPANPRDMTRTVALIVQDTVERATIGMVIPDAEERTNTATPESVLEPTFGRTAETPVFEYVPRRAQDPAVLESPHACSVETAHDRLKTESPGKENQEDKAEDEEPPGPRLDKGKGRAVEAMNSLFSSGSTRTAATEIITKPNNIHAKVGNGDGKAFVAPLSERTRVIPNVAPVEHTSISTISGGGSAIPLTVERKRLLLKKKQPLNF